MNWGILAALEWGDPGAWALVFVTLLLALAAWGVRIDRRLTRIAADTKDLPRMRRRQERHGQRLTIHSVEIKALKAAK